jgi:hypothetical protein
MADASSTSLRLSVAVTRTSWQLIHLGPHSYLSCESGILGSACGTTGSQLTDRWIDLPVASSRAFTATLGSLAPNTLARCLTEDHGTLSIAGTTIVKHRRAIVVKDAGNAPGSSPGTLAIASAGSPYPLTLTVTGGKRAGGHIDVCNEGKATTETGRLTLGDFGHVPPIRAPANVLSLAQAPTV